MAVTKVTAITTGVSLARIDADQERADAGDAEDLLGDDGAAEQRGQLQRDTSVTTGNHARCAPRAW